MAIAEGQFSQVGDEFNIKVKKKSGENDQYLEEVVIHKKDAQNYNRNSTVIIANRGELTSEIGSNTLSLVLNDGNYYSEVYSKDRKRKLQKEFVRSSFEEYIINIDLTEFNNKDIDKENKLNNQNMYNVKELRAEIDSQSQRYTNTIKAFSNSMYFRTGITKFKNKNNKKLFLDKDSISFNKDDTLLTIFNAKHQKEIVKMALNNLNNSLQAVDSKNKDYANKEKQLNKYEIALHEKYALAVTCIILFFVGAPLGAIIRKGGMGLPLIVAIVLFLTYHFIGIFAKNSAEDGTLQPYIAAWLSTLIMLPLGVWLTYRATTDQGIFDLDDFGNRIKKLFKKKNNKDIPKNT